MPRPRWAISSPIEHTEAWVLYDDRNIYVACRCLDEHPEHFPFYVTPVGGMWDSLTTDDRSNNGDWNTVWDAKSRRIANGWIAEIAIPFKSLQLRRWLQLRDRQHQPPRVANFRFRWEYQPGSELFVVYTDGHDTSAVLGAPSLQNRGVVIKANRLFRM